MQRTRREALDEFLGHVNELGDPEARNLAEAALNRAIEAIALERTWRDLISPAPLELTLTVGQRSYALPDHFFTVAPGKIRNLTRGGGEVQQFTPELVQERFPTSGTSLEVGATPKVVVIAGVCGVHTQPAPAGEAIEVLSDSVDDTSGKVVVSIEGDDENGRHRRRQVALTGTSAVAAGTWRWIDKVGKSYIASQTPATEYTSSAGNVTLRTVLGQTELQYLFAQESAKEHRVITFIPKPSQADVIAIPFVLRPKRLMFDGDPLPGDWWPAIFEHMKANWRDNTGEAGTDANIPRPELQTLISRENTTAPRPIIRPIGGGWR